MTEPLRDAEPSLEELLGYEPDVVQLAEHYPFLVDIDGRVNLLCIERAVARKIDLAEKIRKYGARAPVAPYLPEIQDQLGNALAIERIQRELDRQPEPDDQCNLIRLFGFWTKEAGDADKYYRG